MISRIDFFNFLKENNNSEYSKEEIINLFSESLDEEKKIDNLLSELEVDSTISPSNLMVKCKAGTVYFRWDVSK
ncbi:MAG: hypothetical protein ACTHL3_09670 [Candidatus Nitrosocosmicus sp.]